MKHFSFSRRYNTAAFYTLGVIALGAVIIKLVWNYTDVYYTSLLNPNIHHLAYQYTTLQGNMRPGITSAAQTNDVWLKTIDATNPFVQTATISACALLVVVPLLIMYCFVQKRFVQGAARSGLGGD